MISVITAIYNQRAVNELFWEHLERATSNPFELIIIDNGCTDGSADFFESVGATVIRNGANYSYPHSQNQGIAVARYEWLAFLNNDIIVSPGWDQRLMESMNAHGLEVATVCGIEQIENAQATRRLKRRWKAIKNVLGLFGHGKTALRLMHWLMYPDWEGFCRDRQQRFAQQIKPGFVGNTVMMRRSALAKIGIWDEHQQAADFDLFLRCKARARDVGDILPVHICLDAFVHHYIRLTMKAGYPPFADRDQLLDLSQKWSEQDRQWLLEMNR